MIVTPREPLELDEDVYKLIRGPLLPIYEALQPQLGASLFNRIADALNRNGYLPDKC